DAPRTESNVAEQRIFVLLTLEREKRRKSLNEVVRPELRSVDGSTQASGTRSLRLGRGRSSPAHAAKKTYETPKCATSAWARGALDRISSGIGSEKVGPTPNDPGERAS